MVFRCGIFGHDEVGCGHGACHHENFTKVHRTHATERKLELFSEKGALSFYLISTSAVIPRRAASRFMYCSIGGRSDSLMPPLPRVFIISMISLLYSG